MFRVLGKPRASAGQVQRFGEGASPEEMPAKWEAKQGKSARSCFRDFRC